MESRYSGLNQMKGHPRFQGIQQQEFPMASVPRDPSIKKPKFLSKFSPQPRNHKLLPKLYQVQLNLYQLALEKERKDWATLAKDDQKPVIDYVVDPLRPRKYFANKMLSQLFPPKANRLTAKVVSPLAVEEHLSVTLPHLDEAHKERRYNAQTAAFVDTREITQPYRQTTPRERVRTETKQKAKMLPVSPFGGDSIANPDATCLLHKSEEYCELLEECQTGVVLQKANNQRALARKTTFEHMKTQNGMCEKALHVAFNLSSVVHNQTGTTDPAMRSRSEPLRRRKEMNRDLLLEQKGLLGQTSLEAIESTFSLGGPSNPSSRGAFGSPLPDAGRSPAPTQQLGSALFPKFTNSPSQQKPLPSIQLENPSPTQEAISMMAGSSSSAKDLKGGRSPYESKSLHGGTTRFGNHPHPMLK